MSASEDIPTSPSRAPVLAWIGLVLAHVVAVMGVAILVAVFMLPLDFLEGLVRAHAGAPDLLERSLPAIALHLGLSACLWALAVIVYKLWKLPRQKVVHMLGQRGSVMTETLVILPLFLFLTFGLAQLAINNMGGILANVAVYQAARAAWIWQPEIGVERVNAAVTEEGARDRARIAAAQVMTPVAPGEYLSDPTGTDAFDNSRFALAASQVPMGAGLGNIGQLMSAAGSIDPTLATRNNLSLTNALDTKSFLRRTLLKFTHAYEATEVEIIDQGDRVGARLTYRLHEVMPFANRFFGDFDTVGLRMGYFVTLTREYTFHRQAYSANGALPDGSFKGQQGSSDGGSLGDVGDFKW